MLLTVDNAFTAYTSKPYTNETKANSPDEELYVQREDVKAVDRVLQGQDTWLEGNTGYFTGNV